MSLFPPQLGHRRQDQAPLYPSSASTWIVYGYEKLILLLIPTLRKVWGYEKLVLLLIPMLWKAWGYGKLVLLLIPTLWKVQGYETLVLLLIPTLWKVWGYGKLVLLLIPKLWKTEGITRQLYIPECLRQAFVRFTTTLRYEPCIQFINVSQRALHIYFIDGCRRI